MLLKYSRVWGVWDSLSSDVCFVSVARSACVKYCKLRLGSPLRIVRFDVSPLEV